MRRINYLFQMLVLAFVAPSCSSVDDLMSSEALAKKEIVTIEASIENDIETKTVFDGTKIYWKPGDEIKVFFLSDEAKFTSSNSENALTASFNGSITISGLIGSNEGESDDTYLWGLYPYREDAHSTGSSVTTTLPENQLGVVDSFADDLYITLARSNSFKLSFNNVLAGFRFTVTRSDISKVEFSGNNEEDLAGELTLSYGANEKPCVNNISNTKKTITLIPSVGDAFEANQLYYIVFAPTHFTNGFSVTMTTTDGKIGEFVYGSDVTFARNDIKRKVNMDTGVVFAMPDFEDIIPANNEIVYRTENDIKLALSWVDGESNIWKYNWHDDLNPDGESVFPSENVVIAKMVSHTYVNGVGRIVFDRDITRIPSYFFQKSNANIILIKFPDVVREIGKFIFYGQNQIRDFAFPYQLREIDDGAFSNISMPNELSISPYINKIGSRCFNCSNTSILRIRGTLTDCGSEAFFNTNNLQYIYSSQVLGGASNRGPVLYVNNKVVAVATAYPESYMCVPPSQTTLVSGDFSGNVSLYLGNASSNLCILDINCGVKPLAIRPSCTNLHGTRIVCGTLRFEGTTSWSDRGQDYGVFEGSNIKELILYSTARLMSRGDFADCKIEKVTIESGFQFDDSSHPFDSEGAPETNLMALYINMTTPPSPSHIDAFLWNATVSTIYVPSSSLSEYLDAWPSRWSNIVQGYTPSSIL